MANALGLFGSAAFTLSGAAISASGGATAAAWIFLAGAAAEVGAAFMAMAFAVRD